MNKVILGLLYEDSYLNRYRYHNKMGFSISLTNWIKKEYQARYDNDKEQKMLDKENIRQWLIDKGFYGNGVPPKLTDDIRVLLAEKYIELYEKLTGNQFKPYMGNVSDRINNNLSFMENGMGK